MPKRLQNYTPSPTASGNFLRRVEPLKKVMKPLLGTLIVLYALRSGLVDFGALRKLALDPLSLALGIGLQALIGFLLALRWYVLCRAAALKVKWARVLEIYWATAFLGIALPGTVGPDVVKSWYIVEEDAHRKEAAILTILSDRALGSSLLFFVAALSLVFFHADLAGRPEWRSLAVAVWAAAAVLAVGVAFLLFFPTLGPARKMKLAVLRKAFQAAEELRRDRANVFLSLAVGLVTIGAHVTLYRLAASRVGFDVPLAQLTCVMAIYFLSAYFALLPLGIGVGQVVFYQLFAWLGTERPELAASICTFVQVTALLVNLGAGVTFFRLRRKMGKRPSRSSRAA